MEITKKNKTKIMCHILLKKNKEKNLKNEIKEIKLCKIIYFTNKYKVAIAQVIQVNQNV